MEHRVEKELLLSNFSVQLATVTWVGIEETDAYSGYSLSQRLSDNHSPLRIGNLPASAVFPRVGSVGLLPPGQSIKLLPVEKPLRIIYCVFDESYFEHTTQTQPEQWERHTESLVAIKNQRLEILMQEICGELEQPGFGDRLVIEAASTMILVELARYIRLLEQKNTGDKKHFALSPWQLRIIQDRIQVSLEKGYPSIAELAQLCSISEGHLARSFKTATGWQLHKYIAEERVKAAKTLLSQGHYNCEQVSVQLGFKSPAYFSTVFRRMTGKTPTQFRRLALATAASEQH